MTSYYVEEEETNQEMCLNDDYEEWWHEEYSESEFEDELGREVPEPEPPDSYNTHKGYSKPWITFNDDFCSHGSKSPLTRDISFSGKENYIKQREVMEYKGATAKEYNCQRLPRHEEKLDHHTLLYRGPTASRQAKPRHKFFHTNTRVVQEVTQEVTQRSSMWRKPYPRGRRDYLAERDSGITNLRGGELKRGTRRDPLLSNPTRTYQTKLRLSLDNGYEYFGPESFEFAGRERDYLQWELNMDKYFRYYSIPKEERLNYCLEQLMGSAKRWWDREEKDRRWFKEPALKTWGQLKILMRERYAPHSFPQPGQHTYHPKEPSRENTTHQRVSSNQIADQDPAKKNEKGTCAKGEPSSIPVLETHAEPHVETHVEPHVEPHAELKQGLCHSMDDTSKEVDHNVATLKEVENIISFEEQLSETTTSTQVCRNKTYDQAALKGRVIIQPCSTPADLASKIIHIKVALIPNTLHGTMKICEDQREATTMLRLLSDQSKQEVDSGLTHEKVQSNLFHYVHERPLTALIHLSCAKSVETHVGNKETHVDPKEGSTTNDVVQQYQELLICESVTKENEIVTNNILLQEEPPDQPSNQQTKLISKDTLTEDLSQVSTNKEHMEHKGDSPEVRKLNDQIQNQSEPAPLMLTPSIMETRRVSNSCLIKEEPPDFKAQAQTREGFKQATRQLKAPDQNRGVILSFLLKGEPPDAPCTIKPPPYQGKTLASQNRMKANLLSLGADCIVSRSKLFQGRGYDADIQIKPNWEYTKPTGTCIKPVDMEHFGGFLPKWSHNQAQGLGLIIHQQINPKKTNDSSGGIKDQRAESPCWGNLTVALFFPYLGFVPMGLPRKVFNEATSSHQGIIYQEIDSKMLQVHIADVLVDRPGALLAELLAELLSEVPHQMKPNKEIFLILYLDVPQSFIWRPGEYLDHLEASLHALRYTTPHLIKRINSELYLPYLDPIVINVPWIFPLLFERPLKIFQSIKKLPRQFSEVLDLSIKDMELVSSQDKDKSQSQVAFSENTEVVEDSDIGEENSNNIWGKPKRKYISIWRKPMRKEETTTKTYESELTSLRNRVQYLENEVRILHDLINRFQVLQLQK
ncbi:hypothetical protein ISN45_Aa02g012410 [Arabidopsis thaliana x Arabidopsis arenosa]|uniref:Retrotransposon gag domain-containing protein n=1 Tax=Arabidopsis thaliana x Arabidopsis arenosa TaxID=1240361 RepID=A0A8T2BQF9_9BRAS|nr:hypothetical protein ISN45_Aa02g012410 [Arabidopsis thaliana x Arabidopsis arenosa]